MRALPENIIPRPKVPILPGGPNDGQVVRLGHIKHSRSFGPYCQFITWLDPSARRTVLGFRPE